MPNPVESKFRSVWLCRMYESWIRSPGVAKMPRPASGRRARPRRNVLGVVVGTRTADFDECGRHRRLTLGPKILRASCPFSRMTLEARTHAESNCSPAQRSPDEALEDRAKSLMEETPAHIQSICLFNVLARIVRQSCEVRIIMPSLACRFCD